MMANGSLHQKKVALMFKLGVTTVEEVEKGRSSNQAGVPGGPLAPRIYVATSTRYIQTKVQGR